MYYTSELEFLKKILIKMHLQVIHIDNENAMEQSVDFGLRKFYGLEDEYERAFHQAHRWLDKNTIYKMSDEFFCKYFFMFLPQNSDLVPLVIGPYISVDMTHERILEEAEKFRVPAWRISQLEGIYSNIPIIPDEAALFTMINAFGEVLWGDRNAFRMIDVNQELSDTADPFLFNSSNDHNEDVLTRMRMMEKRYEYENELMEVVSHGQSQRAERMLSNFSHLAFEQRMTDSVRNMKNYCIICNTLLRKAAEQGGVHPFYLDSISSEFARKIEGTTNFETGQTLMGEMIRSYCRLVRKHSIRQFSPLVQKTVAYIDADISGDLSLSSLAAAQSINASYLSAQFRKETGKTVTEYVNEKRMEIAARLLRTTRLQIQTIAQHCGMSDVNYFSKLFKKRYAVTPKQYRENNLSYQIK